MDQVKDQKTILDFANIQRKPEMVKSATTDTSYEVDIRPGHESCMCAFFKRYGTRRGPCRHILEKRLEYSNKKLDYFLDRKSYESRAFFNSVEAVATYFEFKDDPEYNHICTLWLSRMFIHGTATADDIYFYVDGKFKRTAKILGTTIYNLYQKKLAMVTGDRIKSQRPECHGRRIEIWKLTEKGKLLMESIHRIG